VTGPTSVPPSSSRLQLGVGIVLTLCLLLYIVQLTLMRPHAWPAGIGLSLSGDTVLASLSDPRPIGRIRLPLVDGLAGSPLTVVRVTPDSDAARSGLTPGATLGVIVPPGRSAEAPLELSHFPATTEETLAVWRSMYRRGP
jgi:hypothetical protein